jgi:hypothetical protein
MTTGIKTTHVDRPELGETLVDDVGKVVFKEGLLLLELMVTRLDEPHPPEPPTGTTYPVARLALTSNAARKLHQRLTGLLAVLEQQVTFQRTVVPPTPPPTPSKAN